MPHRRLSTRSHRWWSGLVSRSLIVAALSAGLGAGPSIADAGNASRLTEATSRYRTALDRFTDALAHASYDAISEAAREATSRRGTLVGLVEEHWAATGTAAWPESLQVEALVLLGVTDGPLPRPGPEAFAAGDPRLERWLALCRLEAGEGDDRTGDGGGSWPPLRDRSVRSRLVDGVLALASRDTMRAAGSFTRASASDAIFVREIAFDGALRAGVGVADFGEARFRAFRRDVRHLVPSGFLADVRWAKHREQAGHATADDWRAVMSRVARADLLDEAWAALGRLATPTVADTVLDWRARERCGLWSADSIAAQLAAGELPGAEGDAFRLRLATAARRRGDFEAARRHLAPLLADTTSPDRAGAGMLALARMERSSGEFTDMVDAYRSVWESDPAHAATAYFECAWEHHTAGDLLEARELYARALGAGHAPFEPTFRGAVATLALGMRDSAHVAFRAAEASAPDADRRARARVWAAITADDADRDSLLEGVRREESPFGYLSRALRSGVVDTSRLLSSPRSEGWPVGPERVRDDRSAGEDVAAVDWTVFEDTALAQRLGYPDVARRLLSRELARAASDPDGQVALAFATIAAGHPRAALRVGYARNAADAPGLLRLRYPLGFIADVDVAAASGGVGLDPLLVAALIRQESRFDERGRSRAGALGLMQLMPATARREARVMGRSYDGAASLLDPRVNVAIGTHHLSGLVARYDDVLRPIAAYNAGKDAVDRWGSPHAEPWIWIETIPYIETRGYVRSVLGHYLAYLDLYRGSIDAPAMAW